MMSKIFEALKLIKQAYWSYRWQVALLSFLGLSKALFEGIGVTSLIPLFALITGNGKLGEDYISQMVSRFFSLIGFDPDIKILIIFILALFILKFLVSLLIHYLTVRIDTRYYEEISNTLFRKMADSSWSYLAREKVGYLQNLLSTNAIYSRNLLGLISAIVVLMMNVFSYLFLAFNISATITSITLILAILTIFLYWPSVSKIKADAYDINKYKKEVAHFVNEKVIGMKTIKVIPVVEEVKRKVSEYFRSLKKLRFKVLLRKKIVGELLEPAVLVYVLVVFLLSYQRPDFNIAAFAVILFLIQRIFNYVNQMQSTLHASVETLPFLKNILEYIDESTQEKEEDSGKASFHFDRLLEFKQVSFFYKEKEEILSNITFAVKKGEMVGLVGPSGAGKTTVADLLLRLIAPGKGCIIIDGENISSINLKEWRSQIGYVPQDIFLINDTITANVKFFDDSITDEEVVEAAKMANIYDFIQSKPQGFATKVGERGLSLSAGQRQRIVLARVLARKPTVLVLDEATSALDNESEMVIQKVIQNLKRKMTVLIIAHRLTTVLNCDRVFALQEGKIIESGNPQQLLSDSNSYFSRVFNINR